MIVARKEKIVYDILDITDKEKAFCKQIVELAQDVIIDQVVDSYYIIHEDELILDFIQDIASFGKIDLHDYA